MNKILATSLALLVLSGCDSFPGPSFRNETGRKFEMVVTYSDTQSISSTWPVCWEASVGNPNLSIEEIVIRIGEKEIAKIDESEVSEMMRREKEVEGYHAWVVKDDEIQFVTDQASGSCPQGLPRK